MRTRITKIKARVKSYTLRKLGLTSTHEVMQAVGSFETLLSDLTEIVDKQQQAIKDMQDNIDTLDSSIDTLDSSMYDREVSIDDLEQRLDNIDAHDIDDICEAIGDRLTRAIRNL